MVDIVNPFAGYRVSLGWTEGSHRNNPAIDYAMPVGTPLYAPCAGTVRLRKWGGSRATGDPGNKAAIYLDDGRSIHLSHMDSFGVQDGQRVGILDFMGRSGNTGNVIPVPTRANPNSGAHLHTFGLLKNGGRWNWINDASATPAGDEDEMSAAAEQLLREIHAAMFKPYGDQFTASINVMRSELATRLDSIASGAIYFPGAGYLLGPALANNQTAILQAIANLDPTTESVDIAKLLEESEKRTTAAFNDQLSAFSASLRAELIVAVADALENADDVTTDTIAQGVDEAFRRRFAAMPSTPTT